MSFRQTVRGCRLGWPHQPNIANLSIDVGQTIEPFTQLTGCPYAFYVLRAENRRQSWLVFSVYRQVKTNQKLAGY